MECAVNQHAASDTVPHTVGWAFHTPDEKRSVHEREKCSFNLFLNLLRQSCCLAFMGQKVKLRTVGGNGGEIRHIAATAFAKNEDEGGFV